MIRPPGTFSLLHDAQNTVKPHRRIIRDKTRTEYNNLLTFFLFSSRQIPEPGISRGFLTRNNKCSKKQQRRIYNPGNKTLRQNKQKKRLNTVVKIRKNNKFTDNQNDKGKDKLPEVEPHRLVLLSPRPLFYKPPKTERKKRKRDT
jgi:hypothetical protein